MATNAKKKTAKKTGNELPRPSKIYIVRDGNIFEDKKPKPLRTTHKDSIKKVEAMKGARGSYEAFCIEGAGKTIATILLKKGCVIPGEVAFAADNDCWYVGKVKY